MSTGKDVNRAPLLQLIHHGKTMQLPAPSAGLTDLNGLNGLNDFLISKKYWHSLITRLDIIEIIVINSVTTELTLDICKVDQETKGRIKLFCMLSRTVDQKSCRLDE